VLKDKGSKDAAYFPIPVAPNEVSEDNLQWHTMNTFSNSDNKSDAPTDITYIDVGTKDTNTTSGKPLPIYFYNISISIQMHFLQPLAM